MKTVKLFALLLAFTGWQSQDLFSQTENSNQAAQTTQTSQNNDNIQAFWIHQDEVKPSKTQEYETVTKDFINACKKHNLKDADWSTAQLDDGTYLSIVPVNSYADLDKNPLAPLAEKMGDDKFREMFQRFNKCYDVHRDYIVFLNKELSYMPDGVTPITPGQEYRKWHFFYVTPENASKLKEKIKAIKDLYAEKGVPQHYRIYRSGFGAPQDYYLAVVSAKDAKTYAETSEQTDKMLGEKGEQLFNEMMQYVDKYESKTGKMRPDLGYVANR